MDFREPSPYADYVIQCRGGSVYTTRWYLSMCGLVMPQKIDEPVSLINHLLCLAWPLRSAIVLDAPMVYKQEFRIGELATRFKAERLANDFTGALRQLTSIGPGNLPRTIAHLWRYFRDGPRDGHEKLLREILAQSLSEEEIRGFQVALRHANIPEAIKIELFVAAAKK